MSQQTPKTAFLAHGLIGSVLLITSEDKEYWSKGQHKPLPMDAIADSGPVDTIALGEVLQRTEKPIDYLKLVKQKAKRLILTVPNESSWNPQYNPGKNPQHKQQYDTDLLTAHLEEAGFKYVVKVIDFSGWSFLAAECSI